MEEGGNVREEKEKKSRGTLNTQAWTRPTPPFSLFQSSLFLVLVLG